MLQFGPGNQPIYGHPVTLAPSAARTSAGNAAPAAAMQYDAARLSLDVTAVSGTSPTMTVFVQHSIDGSTWVDHSAFTAATAVSTQRKVFAGLDRYIRVRWTVGGTNPNFTFSVVGELV